MMAWALQEKWGRGNKKFTTLFHLGFMRLVRLLANTCNLYCLFHRRKGLK